MNNHDRVLVGKPGRTAHAMGAILCAAGLSALLIAVNTARADDLSKYEETVKNASAPPAWAGPTTAAAAPKGKTLIGVSCTWALAGCKLLAQGAEHAAERIGWKAKTIVVNDPNGYDEAVQTAVNSGADGIALTGVDQALIAGGLAAAKKKNVPVVSIYQYNKGGEFGVAIDVHPDGNEIGRLLADNAIVNNKGSVRALMLEDAEFSLPVTVLGAVRKELAACTACKVSYADSIKFTANTIATTLPNRVVAALQHDPSINTIFLGFDPPASLVVPALDAAGFKGKVTMYSQLGNEGPLALIHDNNIMAGDAASSEEWGGWASVDEIIRLLDRMPTVDEHIPVRLFTNHAIDSLPPVGQVWVGTESGFEEQYLKLWGVAAK